MISFIGSGPGAKDLITLRALERIKKADIIIYASSLVPDDILSFANKKAKIYDSKSLTLEEVLEIYRNNCQKNIARLHSGDPSIYGAIFEQINWCVKENIEFEVIPGVSSYSAASAIIAEELTKPGVSQSVILTRLSFRTKNSQPQTESISQLAASGSTMVIFLSGSRPLELQRQLLSPPSKFTEQTPALVAYRVTWPEEKLIETTLGNLAKSMKEIKDSRTILVIVGNVLGSDGNRSNLYNPEFTHKFRKRTKHGRLKS